MAVFARRAGRAVQEEAQRLQCIMQIAVGTVAEQTYVPGDWIVLVTWPGTQFMFYTDAQFRQKYEPVDTEGEQLLAAEYDVICDEEQPAVSLSELATGQRYLVAKRAPSRFVMDTAYRGKLLELTEESLVLLTAGERQQRVPVTDIAYIIQLKREEGAC